MSTKISVKHLGCPLETFSHDPVDPFFQWRELLDQLIAGAAPQEGEEEPRCPGLLRELLPGPGHLGAGVQLHVCADLAELGVVGVQQRVPVGFSGCNKKRS